MSILRLTPHYYWPQLAGTGWPIRFDAMGGMQTQIYRQSLHLADRGVDQTILTLAIPGTPVEWAARPNLLVRGVRIPLFPMRSRIRGMVDLNPSWFLGVLRDLATRGERYTAVHAHGSGVIWPLLAGIVAARWQRVPLVLTIHCSLHTTYHAMSLLDGVLLPFSRWIERMAIRQSARTIVLTERSLAAHRQLGLVEPERFAAIPDCIDVPAYRAHATPEKVQAFREQHRLPTDRPIVAFVGRVAYEKGWPYLVALAQLLREECVHFLVCGDGNEHDTLETELKKHALQDRFNITGFVPVDTVPLAYAVCSVMVLPSLHEEFGGAMIEAMAMGKPVVAFDVGGVSEVLQRGAAGRLVPFGDVAAMKNAVLELLHHPDRREALAAIGQQHVLQRYQIDQVGSQLMNVYDAVTTRP